MINNEYEGKVVVITGGSSGIGLAIAKEFAQRKAKMVLISRNKEKLIQAKNELEKINGIPSSVFYYPADVSDKEQINMVILKIGEKFNGIDVLINSAGIITCGRFADQPVQDLESCLFTNYLGAVYATKAAWPWLKKNKGLLSFVSSVAGYAGFIGYSSYAPPKFAMTGLAECLRLEAKDDGIRISIIYPPDTETPLLEYERKHSLPESIALNKNIKTITAERVAHIFMAGLQKNKFEIYCDFNSRFVRWMKNAIPGLFSRITDSIILRERNRLSGRLNL